MLAKTPHSRPVCVKDVVICQTSIKGIVNFHHSSVHLHIPSTHKRAHPRSPQSHITSVTPHHLSPQPPEPPPQHASHLSPLARPGTTQTKKNQTKPPTNKTPKKESPAKIPPSNHFPKGQFHPNLNPPQRAPHSSYCIPAVHHPTNHHLRPPAQNPIT